MTEDCILYKLWIFCLVCMETTAYRDSWWNSSGDCYPDSSRHSYRRFFPDLPELSRLHTGLLQGYSQAFLPGFLPSFLVSGLLRISTETPTSIASRIPTGIPPVIILRFLSRLLQWDSFNDSYTGFAPWIPTGIPTENLSYRKFNTFSCVFWKFLQIPRRILSRIPTRIASLIPTKISPRILTGVIPTSL